MSTLYIFTAGNPVKLRKIDRIESGYTRIVKLKSLRTDHRRGFFAVADFKGQRLFLTGGFANEKKALGLVVEYNYKSNEWSKCPPLNEARASHSSCCAGEHVYVFGG